MKTRFFSASPEDPSIYTRNAPSPRILWATPSLYALRPPQGRGGKIDFATAAKYAMREVTRLSR